MTTDAQIIDSSQQQRQTFYRELDRNNSFFLDTTQLLIALAWYALFTFAAMFVQTDNSYMQFGINALFWGGTGFFLNALRAWYVRYDAFGTTYNDKRDPSGDGYPLSSMRLNQVLTALIVLLLVFAFMPSAHALSVIDMSTVDVNGAAAALAAQLIILGGAVLGGVLVIFAASAGVPIGKRMIWSML